MFGLKSVYATLMLFLLLGLACAGTFTAGLDVDTYVDRDNPNDTFGDATTLWVASAAGEPVKIAYIGFINAFGNQGIFSPDQVSTATLKLTVSDVEKPGIIKVYFVYGYISPELTWEDAPEAVENASAEIEIDSPGEYTLDATDIIKEAVRTCTEGCPYGLKIVAEGDASVGLASSEVSKGSTELKYIAEM
ncbi:CBM96 family carbohydrate-binding protein [Methanothrix thermoacetophila]|uniref:CBM96 family carbohydrate-binding protein n=1 Tax=Methanothrix thermoacetophila TaxID=2224 RepID=UPI0015847DEF|nr:DNRLRE domain-containing protein [Methanothrix thermoacetophila]